jgi:hypothetical protein
MCIAGSPVAQRRRLSHTFGKIARISHAAHLSAEVSQPVGMVRGLRILRLPEASPGAAPGWTLRQKQPGLPNIGYGLPERSQPPGMVQIR